MDFGDCGEVCDFGVDGGVVDFFCVDDVVVDFYDGVVFVEVCVEF